MRTRVRQIARSQPLVASIPGVVLGLVSWLVTWIRLDYPELVEENYELMQFLPRDVLENDALAGLLNLHMQPPLLNALAALDLTFTPRSHAFLAIIFLVMTLAALFFTVDTLRLVGSPFWLQVSSGVLFALLPATVVYSLWSYNTTPTLFGASLATWGIARMTTKPVWGSSCSALGVLTLVLARSAFLWVFAVLWIGVLAFMMLRNGGDRKSRIVGVAPLVVVVLVVLTTQLHYVSRFGLTTMSSWSGQNLAKALIQSGQLSLPSGSGFEDDSCQVSLLNSLRVENPPLWNALVFRMLDGCSDLPKFEPQGTAAWDSAEKDGKYGFRGNLNWSEELVAGKQWQDVMTRVVLSNPMQLVRMAFTSDSGPRESGVGIYLGPAEDYSEVTMIRQHHPFADLGGLLSLIFAPVAIVFGAIALFARRGGANLALRSTLWFTAALVVYHAAVSNLAEFGEGMRFQAEITGPLIVLLAVGWGALRPSPTSSEAG